jgi:hypothetical protein
MKVHTENDPEVAKALELLPQAKQLAENARKIIAQRSNARMTAQQDTGAAAAANNSR